MFMLPNLLSRRRRNVQRCIAPSVGRNVRGTPDKRESPRPHASTCAQSDEADPCRKEATPDTGLCSLTVGLSQRCFLAVTGWIGLPGLRRRLVRIEVRSRQLAPRAGRTG